MRTSKNKNKEVLGRDVLSKGLSDKDTAVGDTTIKETPIKETPIKETPIKETYFREEKPLRLRPSVVDNFVGKDVYIILRSNNKLEGKLESVAQYEIIVTMAHQPVIIMKHAIDYIGLVSKD